MGDEWTKNGKCKTPVEEMHDSWRDENIETLQKMAAILGEVENVTPIEMDVLQDLLRKEVQRRGVKDCIFRICSRSAIEVTLLAMDE